MTQTLRDLLHESVADADMPDVVDEAWRAGGRARRRRAVSAVAGVTVGVVAIGAVGWALDQGGDHRGASPVHRPTPTTPSAPSTPYLPGELRPDGLFHGTSVWWSPSVAQESSLPAYPTSPLPRTIDLQAPDSGLVTDPISHALAAFAVFTGDGSLFQVRVLGPDGLLRGVDIGPSPSGPPVIQPMRDPEGHLRVRAGDSMLSPSGRYLMFPQDGSLRLLRLRGNHWSTIDTGTQATWDATWTEDDEIALWNPARPGSPVPMYAVSGRRVGTGVADDMVPRFPGDPYGLPRRSPGGSLAQSYIAGADVPQPPALHLSPRQSDWIGVASGPDAILVLPQEAARQKECCQAAGWLDRDTLVYESRSSEGLRLLAWRMGTGQFWQASRIIGWRPGEETVISSYAVLSKP